jgi:hypothetical protein
MAPAAAPVSPVKAADLYRDLKDVDEAPGSNYARAMYERDVRERGRDKSVVPMTKRQPAKKTYERKMGATAEDIAAYQKVTPPVSPPAKAKPLTREELIDQIPRATGSRYLSVASDTDPSLREDGTELGRNVKNTLSALTPLGGGVGKVAAELTTARGAALRAAEKAEREREKVVNPLAWAAGPKRFSEFKKGGVVKAKKMASGGATSSASKRGDGIATKGKTKCKMY